MSRDKKLMYLSTALLILFLLLSFFIPFDIRRMVVALGLSILSGFIFYYIKKRNTLSLYKKQVIIIMMLFGLVYVVTYYASGLKYDFYNNSYAVASNKYIKYVVPIIVIIISTEMIRSVASAQNNLVANAIVFISCIISDLIILVIYSRMTTFNTFMEIFAMTLFPTITSNILYTYISKRYGIWPNVLYRIITSIYLYFITSVPQTADIIVAFVKFIYPLLILLFIKMMYQKERKFSNHKKIGVMYVSTLCLMLIMVIIVMLVSGQFKYGVIVVGSESMTGTINKGDGLFYEQYDDQIIEVGNIIIFESGKKTVVHRVVDIENVNNEMRYYTKGDINDAVDSGYIIGEQIKGIAKRRILYIGYPTLWIRSLFEKKIVTE